MAVFGAACHLCCWVAVFARRKRAALTDGKTAAGSVQGKEILGSNDRDAEGSVLCAASAGVHLQNNEPVGQLLCIRRCILIDERHRSSAGKNTAWESYRSSAHPMASSLSGPIRLDSAPPG